MELDALKKEAARCSSDAKRRGRSSPDTRLVGRPRMSAQDAMIESFMKTLKYEEIYPRGYATVEDVIRPSPSSLSVIRPLPQVIEERYNRRGLPSALRHRPPEELETLNIHPPRRSNC
jgi:transposase InsO family protein